jgi:hypothetical protein
VLCQAILANQPDEAFAERNYFNLKPIEGNGRGI